MGSEGVQNRRRWMGVALAVALLLGGVLGPVGTMPARADFSDIPATFWAAAWINFLAGMGIVKGFPDGTFGPSINVTRDQMAVFVGRAIQQTRAVHGLGWVQPTGTAGTVRVFAAIDFNAMPDATQTEPGLKAGFRLLASSDAVTFTPAMNATFDGVSSNGTFVSWTVTGVTSTTYFKPVALTALVPEVDKALTGVLTARPSDTPGAIGITSPPTSGAARLPEFVWASVPSAAFYLLQVTLSGSPGTPPFYDAAVDGWRTSLLFGHQFGPGIIGGDATVDALAASTPYDLEVRAIDATGWTIAQTRVTFATGP